MASIQLSLGLALAALVLMSLVSRVKYHIRSRGCKPIPGPKGIPFFGNIRDMPKDGKLIPLFNKWYAEYGPIVEFTILGQKNVVLSTERVTNDLLVQRGNIYSDRGAPVAMAQGVGKGHLVALMDRTELWRRERKLLHTVLSEPATQRYEPYIELETLYTIRDLLDKPAHFMSHFERYAFGLVFRIGLGRHAASMEDPMIQSTNDTFNSSMETFRPDKYICNLFPPLLYAPGWLVPSNKKLSYLNRRFEDLYAELQRHVEQGMRDGTAPDSWQRSFLENMAEYGLTRHQGSWVFGTLLGAGTRSPYNALCNVAAVLLEHPRWQTRLWEEVDRVVGADRMPAFADLPQLPTVRAVCKEAIRWRSIVAELGIPHKLGRDDYYEGYFFPKGTVFHANTSAMFSDPEMYPDGAVFNPERWLDPKYPTYKEPLTVYPQLQGSISFGFGRRACPAAHFTDRTMTVMVASLAWALDLRKKVDPTTGREMDLNIEFEPVPNPHMMPFPCDIEPRSEKRAELVRLEAEKARARDPLLS